MIDVLIALKDPLVRLGVQATLEQAADCHVVAALAAADEIVPAVQRLHPNVVVVEAQFQRDDPGLVRRIVDRAPDSRVIVMVEHSDEECILRSLLANQRGWRLSPDAFEKLNECCLVSLRASARGCIPKSASTDRLVGTIRAVAAGDIAAGPWLTAQQLEVAGNGSEKNGKLPRISARELEVIGAVAEGLENKEIAARLGISEQTVKNHLARIMEKLGVRSRVELAGLAIRQHLAR